MGYRGSLRLGYEAVLKQADQALGKAKRAGKNRAVTLALHPGGPFAEIKVCGESSTGSILTRASNV
jgi:hypothetical protein